MPRVAIGQFDPLNSKEENLASARDRCREASEGGAVLLVLPELSLTGWPEDEDADGAGIRSLAEPLDGFLVTALSAMADEFGLTVVAGFVEVADDDDERPYNTLAIVEPGRGLIATHRKTHLYDAFGSEESKNVRPGEGELALIDLDGLKVGIINCYEIRFPERAHRLVSAGADLLTVSAAWPNGPLKEDHWNLNIRARALENTVWVAAAGTTGPDLVGRSSIVDPLGVIRASLDERSAATVVADVTVDRIEWARERLPVLAQRRSRYGTAPVAS